MWCLKTTNDDGESHVTLWITREDACKAYCAEVVEHLQWCDLDGKLAWLDDSDYLDVATKINAALDANDYEEVVSLWSAFDQHDLLFDMYTDDPHAANSNIGRIPLPVSMFVAGEQ